MGLYMDPEVPYRVQAPIVKEKIKTAKRTGYIHRRILIDRPPWLQ